jgi:hypothetical protein
MFNSEFYGGGMGSPFSSRTSQNPVLGFLSSRLNDSCQEKQEVGKTMSA